MQSSSLPEPDCLAQLAGLEDWRVGIHRHKRNRDLFALSLWWVEIQPSFHAHWVIAGVAAGELRPDAPVWRKVILAQGTASGVVEVDCDPVAEALNAVPLLQTSMCDHLDGIGYLVYTETAALTAKFQFANPDAPQLIALERTLRELGERIATTSGSPELE